MGGMLGLQEGAEMLRCTCDKFLCVMLSSKAAKTVQLV